MNVCEGGIIVSILFINASPNKEGNTARLAKELLYGKEYETLNLVDYKIYASKRQYGRDGFTALLAQHLRADA